MAEQFGISGRITARFQDSAITPLLALVGLLLGFFAILVTPREEEPQINVTFADVFIPFPGASATVEMYRGRGCEAIPSRGPLAANTVAGDGDGNVPGHGPLGPLPVPAADTARARRSRSTVAAGTHR